jgi:glycosyltransferase involved in cell wall biosynthesis
MKDLQTCVRLPSTPARSGLSSGGVPPPRVTVGLPFLNAERTLADAVRSVFAQTLGDWRLVLLDDGSTDGSLALARRIRDPRVTVRSDGTHRGLAARLNELAALAEAPLLARMDADDLMHPERLARQVAWFDAHPETDALGTGTYTMDADGTLHGRRCSDPLPATIPALLRRELFAHPSVTFRTAFARANPYDPAYPRAEDLALWCRIRPTARLAVLPEPLLFYREPLHPDLEAYAATQASRRRLIRDLGATVPWMDRLMLRAKARAVVLAYRAAALLGQEGLLVQRRNEPLEPAELSRAQAVQAAVRAIDVAGLERAG